MRLSLLSLFPLIHACACACACVHTRGRHWDHLARSIRPNEGVLLWSWSLCSMRVAPIAAALVLVEAEAGVEVGRHALEACTC